MLHSVEIDAHAAAIARCEIEIAAPSDVVWSVLTDIANWPSWNPDVASMSYEGPLDVGTTFRWKAGGAKITSIIGSVDAPRRIDWSGKTFGVKAIHVHEFEPRDGGTLVKSAESWDGLLVRLFRRWTRKVLQKAVDSELSFLKSEAELRAAARGAP